MNRKNYNDFDLSPPKKPSIFFHWVLPMFFFWGILAALIIAGVIYPQIELVALRYVKGNYEKQMEMLLAKNMEYNQLLSDLNGARAVVDGVKNFKESATSLPDVYAALLLARPVGMVFDEIIFTDGTAQIQGFVTGEYVIHDFAHHLERDKRLTSWVILEVENTGEGETPWNFSMTATYKVPIELADEGAAQ